MRKKTTVNMMASAATLARDMGESDWEQRGKTMQTFEWDLKEAISDVKKEYYRREIRETPNPAELRTIEQEIRTDFQLTQGDRVQLLGELNSLPLRRVDEKSRGQVEDEQVG